MNLSTALATNFHVMVVFRSLINEENRTTAFGMGSSSGLWNNLSTNTVSMMDATPSITILKRYVAVSYKHI